MKHPQKVLILLTSHRSGSTWLSDAIRCHPAVEYCPSAIFYEMLEISGRRYPGDLSNGVDADYSIEVQPGKWDKIPRFGEINDLPLELRNVSFENYGLEKCHPSFFNFDASVFLEGCDRIESSGFPVKLIFLVRDPKSLMTSFMTYQQRKPSWYQTVIGAKLPELIYQTYNCIQKVCQSHRGIILDYSNLKQDLAYALVEIYLQLWPDTNPLQDDVILQISESAERYTDRKNRLITTGSPFLGEIEGKVSGTNASFEEFFHQQQTLVDQCYASYQAILSTKNSALQREIKDSQSKL